jgi:hypothetical protein
MLRSFSRRQILARGAQFSLLGLFIGGATAAAAEKVCADPKTMDSAAASMRSSLNYTEASKDAASTCSVCAFFSAPADGCGTCQIFNGPVNAKGRCDSWSAKS